MAFTLVVVVGPRTRAGQAAWALGGSGHVEGVSLGRGRKARCGGPRDAGWARQKPWSQQTLVSPRLWLKGNQMLPAPCLFPWSPACPPPGPPSVPLLPGLSVSALCPSSLSPVCPPGPPSILLIFRLSSQSSRRKLWSQQTLISPRLWPKGNQMLPASGLSLPAAPLLAVPHSESLPLPCGSCGEPPGGASHHHTHLQSMVGAQWPSEASPPAPSPTASSPRCQALLLSCFLLLSSASRPHLTHCG